MRIGMFVVALAALIAAVGLIGPTPARAGGDWRAPDGYFQEPIVDERVERVERPRYRGDYIYVDPYRYYYRPRAYYPYYDSGYWKPAYEMRKRRRVHHVPPTYYSSWGYPRYGHTPRHRRDRGWGHDRRRW